MDDKQFRQLLDRFGLSWDGYRKVRKGVKKRISRHMHSMGCRTMEAYILALEQSQEAKADFERLMTVSISRFFRDRTLWRALEEEIFPAIIQGETSRVKLWSAGCACGEEAYSLRILWDLLDPSCRKRAQLQILATDANPVYLNKARTGIYRHSSLKETPEALKARYFKPGPKGKTYVLAQDMKADIVWRCHNLLSDLPDSGFHMVLLRNSILTYLKDERKVPILERIIRGIVNGGFLVIGEGERIPPAVKELEPYGHHLYIFRKA